VHWDALSVLVDQGNVRYRVVRLQAPDARGHLMMVVMGVLLMPGVDTLFAEGSREAEDARERQRAEGRPKTGSGCDVLSI
jgi:hypothetical protein